MVNGIRFGTYNLVTLIFLLITSISFAQNSEELLNYFPGYVITSEWDSVPVKVKNYTNEKRHLNYSLMTFLDVADQPIVFDKDIILINKGNDIFITNPYGEDLPGNPSYMKLIRDGEVQLFEVEVRNLEKGKQDKFFLLEANDKVYLLKEDRFKEQLSLHLDLTLKEDKKIGYGKLPFIIGDYNDQFKQSEPKYANYKKLKDEEGNLFVGPSYGVISDGTDRTKAKDEIAALSNGALVVRLKTNKRKIEAYEKAGMEKRAKEAKLLVSEKHRQIIASFTTSFTFCPVYFIKSEDYPKVLNGVKKGYFLNSKGEIDEEIQFTEPDFFFCDRGSAYATVLENSNDAKVKSVSSTPILQDAFVIKDHDLVQLLDPFPYAVAIRVNDFENAAKRLNKNLITFYSK